MRRLLLLIPAALVLLLAGLGAYHILRPDHERTTAEVWARYATEYSDTIDIDGLRIHVMERGQGQTVILLHGLGGNAREFDAMAEGLADSFHVVQPDLPGFGLSEAPWQQTADGLMPFYEAFLAAVIDRFAPDGRAMVVANSLGGWITWETAQRFPDRVKKLVLMAPAGYDIPQVAEEATNWLKNPLVRFMIAKGLSPAMAEQNVMASIHDPSRVDQDVIDRKYWTTNHAGNLDWNIHLATVHEYPDTTHIQEVTAPVLLLWGTHDEIVPYAHAARFQRDLPDARLITYEDCGHTPQLEIPERTTADVRRFLR